MKNMVRFTIKQCTYFLAVAESGGIAQAARSLNISQPAVAQAIDKLEAITGLVLFHRHHARGLELTAQGREFLQQARQLSSCAQAVEGAIAEIAADSMGTIRLGCFQSIAPFHVARLVRAYRSLYPSISIDVREELQGQLIAGLTADEIDLAILYDLGLEPSSLSWEVLSEPRPYVILPANHPQAAQDSVRLSALGSEPYVLFDAPDSREYFYGLFRRYGIDPPIAFRSTSFESVRSAVGNGLGFSILAMRQRSDVTYDGHRVVSVPIADAIDPIKVVLARKSGAELSPLIETFMTFCASNLRQAEQG